MIHSQTQICRLLSIVLLCLLFSLVSRNAVCIQAEEPSDFKLYGKQNLVAWCVVPFDSRRRTPAERTQMLQELGFERLAWDWREPHLDILEEEIDLLRAARIELQAVWCWIDGRTNDGRTAAREIGEANERLLSILEQTGTETEIWVSFAAHFFAGLTDEQRVAKGAATISLLQEKANAIGCRVCLYNHGDWFGEPRNMVKIIRHLNADDVGLIYNFHHAHGQLEDFEENLALMMPYLRCVNLNGMRAAGPKILPLGTGDREQAMMRQLKQTGFQGCIGILGHVEDADVRVVLEQNLAGMQDLLRRMGEKEALGSY